MTKTPPNLYTASILVTIYNSYIGPPNQNIEFAFP